MGVTGLDLSETSYRWHAEEAWLASLIIRAHTNGESILAKANEIVNPIFEGEPVLA